MTRADIFLDIKSGSQIEVIGQIMAGAEKYMLEYKPDLVIVPGDVNRLPAAFWKTITCKSRGIGSVHSTVCSGKFTAVGGHNRSVD